MSFRDGLEDVFLGLIDEARLNFGAVQERVEALIDQTDPCGRPQRWRMLQRVEVTLVDNQRGLRSLQGVSSAERVWAAADFIKAGFEAGSITLKVDQPH